MVPFYIQTLIFVIGIICCITTLSAQCPSDRNKPWSYDNNLSNGPNHWGDTYPACKGQRQSPINIVTSQVARDSQRLQVKNYDEPIKQVLIENNGYRITMVPLDGVNRTLTYNGTQYNLTSVHFHVGSSSNKGSEHEINGEKYSMETHFVHISQAGDSLTLASFLEESNQINHALDVMLVVSSAYTYQGESFQGVVSKSNSNNPGRNLIYLDDLLKIGGSYYHYAGSMTFPPCTENKTWLVLRSNKQVASSQLRQFFGLYRTTRNGSHRSQCHLVNNYRQTQPLNNRTVYG